MGCASIPYYNREKHLVTVGGSTLAAGAIGYFTTPHDGTSKTTHALVWGGMIGLVASVASLYIFDDQAMIQELKRKQDQLEHALTHLKDSPREPKLLYSTQGAHFKKEMPKEYQHLIQPGEWSIYALDQWVENSKGALIHQDKMLKLTPPILTPNNLNGDLYEKK